MTAKPAPDTAEGRLTEIVDEWAVFGRAGADVVPPSAMPRLLQDLGHVLKNLHTTRAGLSETIDERDRAQTAADKLAYAIAPIEAIGEHFSGNDPWANALDEIDRLTKPLAARLAELEKRHDAIWDVVLELRQAATARGLDPYQDPTAQALSAILTGRGAWQITYGTLIEARDDLDAAKARAVDLWERTKFEAEEHATDWEQRGDGSLALVAWDEEQWFDCGPVIRRPPAEPQPEGQSVIALAGTEAAR